MFGNKNNELASPPIKRLEATPSSESAGSDFKKGFTLKSGSRRFTETQINIETES